MVLGGDSRGGHAGRGGLIEKRAAALGVVREVVKRGGDGHAGLQTV